MSRPLPPGEHPVHMAGTPSRTWRIVHSESSPEWGGQEHRILAELAGFQERGCVVALLAQSWSQILQRARERGLAACTFSDAKWQYPWAIARCAVWLRQFRPHVLNTHSSRDAWIAGLAGRLARVPFIVRTKHFDVDIPHLRLSSFVYEKLADHLLTTSPKISERFQRAFGWSPDRVTTQPTGVDTRVFTPIGPAATLGDAASTAAPRIGMVGVLRGAKGHDLLLAAAKQLRGAGFAAHYFIVGDGPKRPEIEKQIREWQLGECVHLTGHREDVAAVFRALQLVVIPSRHEGVPQAALQALATETPVLGSEVGGIPSIIRPRETGRLFPPGDVRALAQGIRDVFADPQTTLTMAKRGRTFVEQHHSLEAMLDKLDALYARHIPAGDLRAA